MLKQDLTSKIPTDLPPPLTATELLAAYSIATDRSEAANDNRRCKTCLKGRTVKRVLVPGKVIGAIKARKQHRDQQAMLRFNNFMKNWQS